MTIEQKEVLMLIRNKLKIAIFDGVMDEYDVGKVEDILLEVEAEYNK